MDKTTEALKKLFDLSRYKKNDIMLEKIVKAAGGKLGNIKFVLKRLFSREYGGSIEAYVGDITEKLKAEKGSVDVALALNEHRRLLREFQEHGAGWYDNFQQKGY